MIAEPPCGTVRLRRIARLRRRNAPITATFHRSADRPDRALLRRSSTLPAPATSPARLRLLAYLALAIALIVLDHRGGWLSQVRAAGAGLLVQPLWAVAGWPGAVVERISDDAGTRSQLTDRKPPPAQRSCWSSSARMARLQAAAADNARLRGLLGAVRARRPRRAAGADPRHRPGSRPASAWCSMPAAATACASARS